MSRDLIFPEFSKHFHSFPLPSSSAAIYFFECMVGSRGRYPGTPATTPLATTDRMRQQDSMHCPLLYLHIGLLCVHQLLDDFSEAIRIRQVAGQRPWRWALALPRSFHAGGLGGVKTPTQHSDLFGTLRGDKSGKCIRRCPLLSTAHEGHKLSPSLPGNLLGGTSRTDGFIRRQPL